MFCWTTRLSFPSWLRSLNIRCISHIRYSMLICLMVCRWAILVDTATVVACLCAVSCLGNEIVLIILPDSVQVRAEAEENFEHPAYSYSREQPSCSTPKDEKRLLNSNQAISSSSEFQKSKLVRHIFTVVYKLHSVKRLVNILYVYKFRTAFPAEMFSSA